MAAFRSPTEFVVYQELQRDSKRGMTFTELRKATGRTPRVVSWQLKRLMEAGVIVHRPVVRPTDSRSRSVYQVGPGWPWIECHRGTLEEVARAVSERRVFFEPTVGARDPGAGGVLVYNDLIVQADSTRENTEESPLGTYNSRKVERALRAVRVALAGEDPLGYHWGYLLRRIIAEIVTSQPRPYFLLSYPASNFSGGMRRTPWPDFRWRETKLPGFGPRRKLVHPPSPRDMELFGRFGVAYLGFQARHLRRAHKRTGWCNCPRDRLEGLLKEFLREVHTTRSRPVSRGALGSGKEGARQRISSAASQYPHSVPDVV